MLIIHAVKKLLSTSRIEVGQYITKPAHGQLLHSWYASLISSGFPGKLMTMYVHEPSLLTVVCPGKSIMSTWPIFAVRLPSLLQRYQFADDFIAAEMLEATGYVVAKTNSRSMLGYMNQMVDQLEYNCSRYETHEAISLDLLEAGMMDFLYAGGKRNYSSAKKYWQHAGLIV